MLTLDELESLRLADLEGLYQETASARMKISRQTFGNIIASARRKVADALINSKALKIEGGCIRLITKPNVAIIKEKNEALYPNQ